MLPPPHRDQSARRTWPWLARKTTVRDARWAAARRARQVVRWHASAVAFDLRDFRVGVEGHAHEWDALGLKWSLGPIHPNYGKAVTSATFEGDRWFAHISVWETGEADLETVRLADQQTINKQYELASVVDLETLLGELLRLLRDGEPPPGAFIP